MKSTFRNSALAQNCLLFIFIAVLLLNTKASAQNIIRTEYYIDTDPGFGMGTNVPVVPAANINNLQFSIPLGAVSYGFHTIFVRAMDANGHWSLNLVSPFYRVSLNTNAIANIVDAEYFIDSDPGFGQGTNILVSPAPNVNNLQVTIGLGAVANGFHILYIRAKDANGRWSLCDVSSFYKLGFSQGSLPLLTKLEYFLDTDPGFGLGTNISFVPAANISNLQFNIPLGSVTPGFHTLYVRGKDASGHWSMTQVSSFFNLALSALPLPQVTTAEFFLDADPGFGMGINVPVAPSTNISNLQFPIDLTAVSNGFHVMYVRAKDARGRWSHSNVGTFFKSALSPAVLPDLTMAEYFIDSDPGFGLGSNIPVTPAPNISNLPFTINLASVTTGFHTLYVRAKDANGRWALTQVQPFFKTALTPAMPDVAKVEYFFDNDPGRGSGTNVPVVPSVNINNLSFTIDVSSLPLGTHTLWVRAKDIYGKWSHLVWDTVIQVNLPVTVSIAASGNSVCAGTPVTFTATPVNGGTTPAFQWKVNGTNAGTNNPVFSYTPNNNDAVSCVLTSDLGGVSGNPAASNVISMIVSPSVPVSLTISASANPVCPGSEVTFSAVPVNGGSSPVYQWKVNGNNAGINNWQYTYLPVSGDIITCGLVSNASCTSGNPAISSQIIMSLQTLNATITGASTACVGNTTGVFYTTEPGMTGYIWSVSAGGLIINGNGTNTIEVVWSSSGSKTVSVTYGNGSGCVTQNPGLLNVAVLSPPVGIGVISGPAAVCVGTQGVVYSVAPVSNASGYQWVVPSGATIVSGVGTNAITVNFANTPFTGSISVSGTNFCGSGASSPNFSVAANSQLTGQKYLTNISVEPLAQLCESAQSILTGGGSATFLVKAGGEATLIASQYVRLLPGTTINSSGKLHAYITNQCLACPALKDLVEDPIGFNGLNMGTVVQAGSSEYGVSVYPNPTSGSLMLEFLNRTQQVPAVVEIYNAQGKLLLTVHLPAVSKHKLSLSNEPSGLYFLRVITEMHVETIKVIRR